MDMRFYLFSVLTILIILVCLSIVVLAEEGIVEGSNEEEIVMRHSNILSNPSFEGVDPDSMGLPANWNVEVKAGEGNVNLNSMVVQKGSNSVKLAGLSADAIVQLRQRIKNIEVGATYLITGWYKTDGITSEGRNGKIDWNSSEVMVKVTGYDGSNNIVEKNGSPVVVKALGHINRLDWAKDEDIVIRTSFGERVNVYRPPMELATEWTKLAVALTVPEDVKSLEIALKLYNSAGSVWFDDIEVCKVANLMPNASFEREKEVTTLRDIRGRADNWRTSVTDGRASLAVQDGIAFEGEYAQRITGTAILSRMADKSTVIMYNAVQDHHIMSSFGDEVGTTYLYTLWVYTSEDVDAAKEVDVPLEIKISAMDYNMQPIDEWHISYARAGTGGQWKAFHIPIVVPHGTERLWPGFTLRNSTGTVYLDNSSLVKVD